MLRRTFLRFSAVASAAGFSLGARLTFDESTSESTFRNAWAESKRRGRPLLAIVTPTLRDATEAWERGQVAGAFFANASDDELLDLSLVDVACATRAEVRSIGGERVASDAWFVLLSPETEPAAVWCLSGPIQVEPMKWDKSAANDREWNLEARMAEFEEQQGAPIRARNAKIASFLREHLTASIPEDRLAILAKMASDALDADEREAVQHVDVAELDPARIERAAAVLLQRARTMTKSYSEAVRIVLIVSTRARLIEKAPAGAAWATNTGCGGRIDGRENEPQFLCGAGFIGAKIERRFLHFLMMDAKKK